MSKKPKSHGASFEPKVALEGDETTFEIDFRIDVSQLMVGPSDDLVELFQEFRKTVKIIQFPVFGNVQSKQLVPAVLI